MTAHTDPEDHTVTTPDRTRVITDAAAAALHQLTCATCPGCGGPDDTERWMAEAVVTAVTPLIQAEGPAQLAAAVAMLKAHDTTVNRLHKRILQLSEPALVKLVGPDKAERIIAEAGGREHQAEETP